MPYFICPLRKHKKIHITVCKPIDKCKGKNCPHAEEGKDEKKIEEEMVDTLRKQIAS